MKVVRTRLFALILTALAVVGLAGCQTKTGAAAIIGDQRVSENQLNDYVVINAAAFSTSSGEVVPRTYVLQQIVLGHVFEALVVNKGGPATASEKSAARAQALSGSTDSEITGQIVAKGFKPKFEPVLIDTSVMLAILRSRYAGADDSTIVTAAKKLDLKIKISPRYGKWDSASLSVTNGPAVGNFLRLPAVSA